MEGRQLVWHYGRWDFGRMMGCIFEMTICLSSHCNTFVHLCKGFTNSLLTLRHNLLWVFALLGIKWPRWSSVFFFVAWIKFFLVLWKWFLYCAGVQPSACGGNALRGSEESETTAGRRQPAGFFFTFSNQQSFFSRRFYIFPTSRFLFSTRF